MKYVLNPALVSISILAGCADKPPSPDTGGQPAFRVRTDFTAALNSDQGWAGALNENVTIPADRPFRVRLEAEQPPGGATRAPFRLQYRRNGGDWTEVEAHDFPHPVRELELDFAQAKVGATPEGWSVTHGGAGGMIVAPDGQEKVVRAKAARESLTGLYTTPWAATEFAAEFRLPAGNRHGLGFVFGYTVHYNIRSSGGTWGAATVLDPGVAPKSAGPRAVVGANDTVTSPTMVSTAQSGIGGCCATAPSPRGSSSRRAWAPRVLNTERCCRSSSFPGPTRSWSSTGNPTVGSGSGVSSVTERQRRQCRSRTGSSSRTPSTRSSPRQTRWWMERRFACFRRGIIAEHLQHP